jgi:uncharacterized protein YbaP (TraB family)
MRWASLLVATLIACKSGEAPTPASKTMSGSATAASGAAVDPWADDRPKALPPPKVTRPLEAPFVWIATRDGKTTYLFGTVHAGVNAEHRIPLWVWEFFDRSTTLVEEANLQDLEIIRWTVRPDGAKTLHQELGDDYWKKLEDTITPMQAGFLDTQSTAVAALRVSGYGGSVADRNAGSMDGELLVRAQGLAKRIEFLESGTFQSQLFGELFDIAALKRLLDSRDQLKQLNPKFMNFYLAGDDAMLDVARAQFRLQCEDDAHATRMLDRLLLSRNKSWIPTLEKLHAAGGAFVAVGALHLIGEGSVVELLRSRGFTVERATAPSP